jgi:hypothetical protein
MQLYTATLVILVGVLVGAMAWLDRGVAMRPRAARRPRSS